MEANSDFDLATTSGRSLAKYSNQCVVDIDDDVSDVNDIDAAALTTQKVGLQVIQNANLTTTEMATLTTFCNLVFCFSL